jgi:hypothetical protein
MRYAAALAAALALGAAASLYTPKADAGVVVGVGRPLLSRVSRTAFRRSRFCARWLRVWRLLSQWLLS